MTSYEVGMDDQLFFTTVINTPSRQNTAQLTINQSQSEGRGGWESERMTTEGGSNEGCHQGNTSG